MTAAGPRWRAAFIVVLVFAAAAGAAFTGWWYARESPPHQGPIVLITADGLSANRLAVYGAGRTDQPAIDALAGDGVVFERVYAHSPQTLPAHAALLSGQLPFENGVRDDAGFALADQTRTLPELLRNRGFATGAAVSTFLLRPRSGVSQGFTFFDAELPAEPDGPPAISRDGEHTIAAAERWVNGQDGRRFLLFLQVEADAADAAVDRIVERLRARDFYDQATILLVGDRGAAGAGLGDDALLVPLIVKQPDGEGAGRRVEGPVQHIDLLPTILDLVRAPVPSNLRGRSLRDVLDGNQDAVADTPIYAEWLAAYFAIGGDGVMALTNGALRLVRDREDAVYDLQAGGRALPLDAPEAQRLRETLDRLLADVPVTAPAAVDPAEERAFAALGYLPGRRLSPSTPAPLPRADQETVLASVRTVARLLAAGDLAGGLDRLGRAARAYPRVAALHYEMASLLTRAGRLRDAANALELAAGADPDHPAIPMTLASLRLRLRDYQGAQASAERAVALAELRDPPSVAAAHEIAARVALARADAETAVRHAEAAQQADDTLPLEAFVQGRVHLEEARFEDALQAFERAQAAAEDRGHPMEDLHLYLGDTLSRLERYDEAEAQYRREIEAFPASPRAYAGLVMLYRASNREDEAEQVIADLMEAAPTPEGYVSAARLWTALGDRSRADALRADARKRFRGDPLLTLLELEP